MNVVVGLNKRTRSIKRKNIHKDRDEDCDANINYDDANKASVSR